MLWPLDPQGKCSPCPLDRRVDGRHSVDKAAMTSISPAVNYASTDVFTATAMWWRGTLLLEYDAASLRPRFRRNVVPSSSRV